MDWRFWSRASDRRRGTPEGRHHYQRCGAAGYPTLADIVFLDFEASSLGKHGYPIEVAWVFATGPEESWLIKPALSWTDWSPEAEATHRISREQLKAEGAPHEEVARRMVSVLTGHELYATAPSWDGKWLSKLLRSAGLPRHALRLQDTDVAHRKAVFEALEGRGIQPDRRESILKRMLTDARDRQESEGPPAHRALEDARQEMQLWHELRRKAELMDVRADLPSGP
jgi:hypothetical protein